MNIQMHIFRLQQGQDLYQELQKLLHEKNIEAAVLFSIIGSLSQLSIRFAAAKNSELLIEEFEILQISGTLSKNGLHLHGSFSKKDGSVIGGHFKPGSLIRTTAEVCLAELSDWTFSRTPDEKTGYLELIPTKKF